MNDEAEVGLRKYAITVYKERPCEGGNTIACDWNGRKLTLADYVPVNVKSGTRHFDIARRTEIRERKRLIYLYAVRCTHFRLRRLGDAFERGGVEIG